MPFIEGQAPLVDLPANIKPVDAPAPDFLGETVPAAFRLFNTVGSSAARESRGAGQIDAEFDPFADLAGYEEHAMAFSRAIDSRDVSAIKRQIDGERSAQEVIGRSGAAGVAAGLAAGVLDPINLIPVGGALAKARSGYLAKGAAAGLAGGVLAESVLQSTQETMTMEESAIAVAASTLLGGVLGGATGLVRGMKTRGVDVPVQELVARDFSMGAAEVDARTFEETAIASAAGMEKAMKFQDPLLRTMGSDLNEARKTAQRLAETPLFTKGNEADAANPIAVESKIKRWNYNLYQGLSDVDDAFRTYRTGAAKGKAIPRIAVRDAVLGAKSHLTYEEFKVAVSRALRNGDQAPEDIPAEAAQHVNRAAQGMRQRVLDPLKEAAIEARLLPEDVDVSESASYLTRVYNREKITAHEGEFKRILQEYIAEAQKSARGAIGKASKQLEAEQAKLDALIAKKGQKGISTQIKQQQAKVKDLEKQTGGELADMTPAEIEQIAVDTIQAIRGQPEGRVAGHIKISKAGPLQERTLHIPDQKIEAFLENDIERVARIYVRSMAPDVELTREFGSIDLRQQVDNIRQEAARSRKDVTDPKKLKKIVASEDHAVRDILAMRDRLRGTYAIPMDPGSLMVRTGRVMRSVNYLRLLGGMTLSAIPDLGHIVMADGFRGVFRDGLVPMIRNFKHVKLAMEETKIAGTGLDMVLDSRTMAMADIVDDYGSRTRFERGLQGVTDKFGVVSLMAPWNAAAKQFYGLMVQNRMIRASLGGGEARDFRRLAQMGLNQSMVQRIGQQIKKHGVEDGVWWANTGQWDDVSAREAFGAALSKEVDRIIVTPGQDKPLWMSTEMGKVIGQFRSFTMASTQRVLLSGLQQRDAAVVSGLASMIGLGMLAYYFKQRLAGREVSDDPAVWLAEGIDRSGATGWLYDANNMAEKLSNGHVGIGPMLGAEPMSRYASRNWLGAALGPSFGLAADVQTAFGAALDGEEWSERDTHAIRKLVPYQNLFYLRNALNQVEQSVNESIGAK